MALRDYTPSPSTDPGSGARAWSDVAPRPAGRARAPGRPTGRRWKSASRPATTERQRAILRLLAAAPVGFSVSDVGRALGISRQLALYHVKKLAAAGELTMMLEPCEANGGLQYAVWDNAHLAREFGRRVVRSIGRGRAA
jgi:DNA-binding CsgD family transcriptional regulator